MREKITNYNAKALKFIGTDGIVMYDSVPTSTSEEWLGRKGIFLRIVKPPSIVVLGSSVKFDFDIPVGKGILIKDVLGQGFADNEIVTVSVFKIRDYTITGGTVLEPDNLNDLKEYTPTINTTLNPVTTGGTSDFIGSGAISSTNQNHKNFLKEIFRDIYLKEGHAGFEMKVEDGSLQKGAFIIDYIELDEEAVALIKGE